MTQFLYQLWTGWSGTSLYEQWTLALYNVAFSLLPVIAIGIFETDHERSFLLSNPEIYQVGINNRCLNIRTFLKWMLYAIGHSMISIFIPFLLYNGFSDRSSLDPSMKTSSPNNADNMFFMDFSGANQESSWAAIGYIVYGGIVLVANFKICFFESRNVSYSFL
jgi:magnesium-transporting ATPase (P-type)